MLLLPEGRADEAYEPSNNAMLFSTPPPPRWGVRTLVREGGGVPHC